MTKFFNSLNLRPQERRLVVVIAVVVFIVLNVVWVRPHFKDLGDIRQQMEEGQRKIASYQEKIAKNADPKNGYEVILKEMEKKQGGGLTNSGAVQLQTTVMTESASAGVTVNGYANAVFTSAGTNDFFEVQSTRITFDSGEKELVDFLVNIGSDTSMIRVRDLNLSPGDQNRYKLKGGMTLTANYRKQAPKEAAPAPKAAPASARKPGLVPGANLTPGPKKTSTK